MSSEVNLSAYHLTFDDEFNFFNSTPNGTATTWATTLWGVRNFSAGAGDQSYFSDSSVGVNPFAVGGGVLTITAAPGTNPAGRQYNSGVIDSKAMFSQTYGYFEMRAELPAGAGMWPAFWTQDTNDYAAREIDVLEAFGAPNASGEGGAHSAHWDVHDTSNPSGTGAWAPVVPDATAGFHAYGVMWDPKNVTFYFDGQPIGQVATPANLNVPQYLIANVAVGGQWPGQAAGETGQMKIDYIRAFSNNSSDTAIAPQTVSSPDGGGTSLYGATVAGGAPGAGTPYADTLTLLMSEDAYHGDAQGVITIDGKTIGGAVTVTALHSQGKTQSVTLTGQWGPGAHDIGVQFINDAYAGTITTDRNLYVVGVSLDGQSVAKPAATLLANGTAHFAKAASPLVLQLSEDAYQGDAQFTVAVDGKTLGKAQSVTSLHASEAAQDFSFGLAMPAGSHDVAVSFTNDAYGGTATLDRNLYVNAVVVNGAAVHGTAATLLSASTQHFSVVVAASG